MLVMTDQSYISPVMSSIEPTQGPYLTVINAYVYYFIRLQSGQEDETTGTLYK